MMYELQLRSTLILTSVDHSEVFIKLMGKRTVKTATGAIRTCTLPDNTHRCLAIWPMSTHCRSRISTLFNFSKFYSDQWRHELIDLNYLNTHFVSLQNTIWLEMITVLHNTPQAGLQCRTAGYIIVILHILVYIYFSSVGIYVEYKNVCLLFTNSFPFKCCLEETTLNHKTAACGTTFMLFWTYLLYCVATINN